MDENNEKQRKLYFMTESLKDFHSKLTSQDVQMRIPLENLSLIANILLEDPTIFEIVKGLKDLQNETERYLKKNRNEAEGEHQKEIEEFMSNLSENELAHTVALAKLQHAKRMADIDKRIIESIDSSVKEQQQTLFALKIPGFYETTDGKAITTQMHLFAFLLRLQKLLETQN